jgi:DNA-binding phage protein
MALTRSFRETVQARVKRDSKFRRALLLEGVEALVSGDLETGKSLLRDFINATVGFEALGEAVGIPPKSLMRMFGPGGNPQSSNLVAVLRQLQVAEGVVLEVRRRA